MTSHGARTFHDKHILFTTAHTKILLFKRCQGTEELKGIWLVFRLFVIRGYIMKVALARPTSV